MYRLIIFVTFLSAIPELSAQHQPNFGPQITALFQRPYRPPAPYCPPNVPKAQCPTAAPISIPSVVKACPIREGKPIAEDYKAQVDKFVRGLNARLPNFNGPFISDFDPTYANVTREIFDKILEISDESVDSTGFRFCSVANVAEDMKNHPKMNYKFYQRALSMIIMSRPELANSLESDPLDSPEESVAPGSQSGYIVTGVSYKPCPTFGVAYQSCPVSHLSQCVGRLGQSSDPDEDLLWYFREDVGINKYHDMWHTFNSYTSAKDKRGELFYYFHRNLIARYNTERVTHSMPVATGLIFSAGGTTLNPGYYPNLKDYRGRRKDSVVPVKIVIFYPDYLSFTYADFLTKIEAMEKSAGFGTGANEIGMLLETGVHNKGHDLIGSITEKSVMSHENASLRDPIFYQWHSYVNSVMHMYKNRLPSYQPEMGDIPLSWNSFLVRDISVVTDTPGGAGNTLHTFWKYRIYHSPSGPSCRQELDHEDFTFHLNIINQAPFQVQGTVRIFLAPTKGSDGKHLTLEQQQDFIFILEIFNHNFAPGENAISRHSAWLSTTAPRWNDKVLLRNRQNAGRPVREISCGCGYPHNLLLPMGNDCPGAGEEFDLVVMVTDRAKYPFSYNGAPNTAPFCMYPPVLCGSPRGMNYTDVTLPMGYPFDRHWRGSGYGSVASLAGVVPNMAMRKINIVHHDAILQEEANWTRLLGLPKISQPNPRCGSTPTPHACWYDYGGLIHCHPIPYGWDCTLQYGNKYCKLPPTPTPPPCWYDYGGVRHCHAIPAGWECFTLYNCKYCKPAVITTDPCWYDYFGRRYCIPIPPGCVCKIYNGLKYCQATVTVTTPRQGCFYPTCAPPTQTNCYYNGNYQICSTPSLLTDCYYDQYMTRKCAPLPANYNCVYNNHYKQCTPPTEASPGYERSTAQIPKVGQYQGYGWFG